MDVHIVAWDVCFDSLGAFVVHYVERGCIPADNEVGKNGCEHCNHGTIVFGWHGVDNDGVQIVNVCYKHVLHIAERLHGVGTGAVGEHHPGV